MKKTIIPKKTLLLISGIADAIDFTGLGLFPGPWSLIIDLPVTIIHFLYAGPRAFVVLGEYVPGAGLLPIYTLAALSYPEDKPTASNAPAIVDAEIVPAVAPAARRLPPPLPVDAHASR